MPDKGQRLRNAISEIEKCLAVPSSPMDCDIINQFDQMTMSSDDPELTQENVYLEKPESKVLKPKNDNNFSEERLNEVKQRLKAREAERKKQTTVTTAKLISLDEAVRLHTEEKKQAEVNYSFLIHRVIVSYLYIGAFNPTNNSSITWKYVAFEYNIWSSIEY